MNTESTPPSTAANEALAVVDAAPPAAPARKRSARLLPMVALLALGSAVFSGYLWSKLGAMQEQLARQSGDATVHATEARAIAKQAQELAVETAAKLVATEVRLSEASLQRTQLEELMQSLSRSRDENLVVDIESAIRLAQQQAQLTGSVEPLLAALKSADVRVRRASQPRLTSLQRAIARDVARISATPMADTPSLLVKLDELVLLADDLPVANAVALVRSKETLQRKPEESMLNWWNRLGVVVQDEVRGLVRVSRIETPEAALLSPEQSFFVRENLKLRLLNARLNLLSRQSASARSDLATASLAVARYFDANARKTQVMSSLLLQVRSQTNALEIPRIDDTLTSLTTVAAGR